MSLRDQLNQRFNKTWGTVGGKITDVPGMSKSMIPLLAQKGIQVVHIGYNPAVLMPPFPGAAFLWKHLDTDTQVIGKQLRFTLVWRFEPVV